MLLAHRPIDDVKKLLSRTRIVGDTPTIVNQAEIIKAIAAPPRRPRLNYEETEDDLIGIAVRCSSRRLPGSSPQCQHQRRAYR